MFGGQTDTDLEKIKLLFTYEQISKLKTFYDNNGTFYSQLDSTLFIKFGYIGEEAAFQAKLPIGQKSFPSGGWKLHIAIDDRIPGNVAMAWNIVKDILIDQRIAESKVIRPGTTFAEDITQCGKQITIYQFYNPNRNWAVIINEIETRLLSANVRPTQFSPTDMPIIGSRYITYRNDLNADGTRAMTAREVMQYTPDRRYNPFERPNPFVNISINQQPEPTVGFGSSISPI